VAAASILVNASECHLRFMLLASVKSVFSKGLDVGSIVRTRVISSPVVG
jgi:hypothetical protein